MAVDVPRTTTQAQYGHYLTSTYNLRRYVLRSILTAIGPLLLLGFYAYIYGNWVFYAWFVVSVLMLDWARTGLANIEAYALMFTQLAPSIAMCLMWHTDENWANPLWWLRALWSYLLYFTTRKSNRQNSVSPPQKLWMLLSVTMTFLFAAIPLSRLSIQTTQILVKSTDPAEIFGPNERTFGDRPMIQSARIRNSWQSGRRTTPQRNGLFYAPATATSGSETYYDDLALSYAPNIEVFVGPTVGGTVVGRTWGIWINASCQPISESAFQVIRTRSFDNISINTCSAGSNCTFTLDEEIVPGSEGYQSPVMLPLRLKEAGDNDHDLTNYSITAAADGYTGVPTLCERAVDDRSPYFDEFSHDNFTFDHFNGKPASQKTTAIFEIYVWQSRQNQGAIQDAWIRDPSDVLLLAHEQNAFIDINFKRGNRLWVGFGVHCDITTAVGFADVDPSHRTFANFTQTLAVNSMEETYPVQIQALNSLSLYPNEPTLDSKVLETYNANSAQAIWAAIQEPVRLQQFHIELVPGVSNVMKLVHPLLKPRDLQLSMYKLFGESIIALMDEDGIEPWHGDLYKLRLAPYIVAGPMPWQYVMALLAVWSLITSCGGMWMLVTGRRRWAATLHGFEMFKVGAQWSEEMNELTHKEFQHCSRPLVKNSGNGWIDGGTRPMHNDRPDSHDNVRPYFFRLSENALGRSLQKSRNDFTFDRSAATLFRS